MDLWSLARALARSWWLIAGVAFLSVAVAWLFLPDAPYQVTVKASVIVAGDTEQPGQAERPELMVLDDLLPLVESPVFAELVHRSLPSAAQEHISVEDVREALSGSRYSRIMSVIVSDSSPDRVKAIGDAVNVALPAAVGAYLVAPDDTEPTTRIIDPGGAPEQQSLRRWISIGVVTLFAVFGVVSLIWLREALRTARGTLPGAQDQAKESFLVKKVSR